RRVRESALSAYAHQDLPFERLVEALKPERDPSRNPIFQLTFQLLNTRTPIPELAGLTVEALERENDTAKLDFELSLEDTAGGLACFVEYSSDLFEAATVERLLGHYRRLLSAMVAADPCRPVLDLALLGAEEERQLIGEWNDTARDYGAAACLHDLVAAQAQRTPGARAVIFEGRSLSYAELDGQANRLANHLRSLGVGPEVLVAICIERSLEMVVGLLGILKAGGAYVPLDPGYPDDRLAYMLEDSRAPVLLTQKRLMERLARLRLGGPELIPLELAGPERAPEPPPVPLARPDHPAYAIYTSGSTGRPKGAVNSHRGIVNRLRWMQEVHGMRAEDRVLHKTPFSFDISVWELF